MYSAALREYVARHGPDAVTEALSDVAASVGEASAEADFAEAAARQLLDRVEW